MKENIIYSFMGKGVAFFAESVTGRGLLLRVLYQDGRAELISMSVPSFLNQIVHFFGYDLIALRKQFGQAIGRKHMVPLPLLEDWILVPLKLSNIVDGEFFTGWIVAQSIVHLEEETTSVTKLYLEGNQIAYCAHRLSYCDQQIRHVALVQHRYQLLHHKENHLLKEGRLSYFR